jgi:hypothetical protein
MTKDELVTLDEGFGLDVKGLDERVLLSALGGGDREAFAELRRRYDPALRLAVWRAIARPLATLLERESVDEVLAEFWCSLVGKQWRPPRVLPLGPWLALLATRSAHEHLPSLVEKFSRRVRYLEAVDEAAGAAAPSTR